MPDRTRKTLILMRHAKADWNERGLSDHDRALNARGERAAHLMGVWLKQKDIRPDLIWCSDARRTRQTLNRVTDMTGWAAAEEIRADLYLASADELYDKIQAAPADAQSLMIVGHNEGLEILLGDLLANPGDIPELKDKFPTAAVAVVDFRGDDWSAVQAEQGRIRRYASPKMLV